MRKLTLKNEIFVVLNMVAESNKHNLHLRTIMPGFSLSGINAEADTRVGLVPEGMILTTGFEIDNKIFMGTGGTPDMITLFYEFDPATSSWTKKADFPGPVRRFASAFALRGKGYISCGQGVKELSPGSYEYISLKDTWQYDPVSDSWTQVNNYPGVAFIHQVSANSDTKACVGTGETGPYVLWGKDFWMVR